jgi:hypothetical protein
VHVRAGFGRLAAAGGLVLLAACGAGGGPDAGIAAGSGGTATGSAAMQMPRGMTPPASTTTPPDGPPVSLTTPPGTAGAGASGPAVVPPGTVTEPTAPAMTSPVGMPVSEPLALSVPAIGVDSPLVQLGRNADGTVEVPSLDDPDARPGWFRDSPTPGALGPAIILGHVDSRRYGPGVFYRLGDLRPGDGVTVTRADGTVATFTVDAVRQVAKTDFPTLEVYGNLDHAGLRLITCGGEFDPDARSYESNVIVFASLAGT